MFEEKREVKGERVVRRWRRRESGGRRVRKAERRARKEEIGRASCRERV